ncbi:MAG TPA: hypothetical protein VFV67_18800 [Actinophytocola sp.]|uniref:hypothetical protein n=1 Tax=Actinophytocola sp. TaxID=1872138 RepID=UPI002DBA0D36|nr:hypothetical protein [Actinophytocola sp.]HEU5472701.1 hypothetical protein [Actinophytocola sp.]
MGTLLARAGNDCNDIHAANTQARIAFMCADMANHNGLRARIRGLQSAVAHWAGQPKQALRYAQSGAVFASGIRSTSAVRLPMSEARAWAVLGNAEQAYAAILRAERALDQIEPDELDQMGAVCAFGHARQLEFAAMH